METYLAFARACTLAQRRDRYGRWYEFSWLSARDETFIGCTGRRGVTDDTVFVSSLKTTTVFLGRVFANGEHRRTRRFRDATAGCVRRVGRSPRSEAKRMVRALRSSCSVSKEALIYSDRDLDNNRTSNLVLSMRDTEATIIEFYVSNLVPGPRNLDKFDGESRSRFSRSRTLWTDRTWNARRC